MSYSISFQFIHVNNDSTFTLPTTIRAIEIQKILKWACLLKGIAGMVLAVILMTITKQSGGQKTPSPT